METYKMLALSTAHLTSDTIDKLNNNVSIEGLVIYEKDTYGWFIPVLDDELSNLENGNCPADLYRCIHYAHINGFDWLMFDCDVEPLDALPTYS